jgi:hypothetical protein
MPLVILQYLYSLQIKGDLKKTVTSKVKKADAWTGLSHISGVGGR